MKKLVIAALAAIVITFSARGADAKVAALYASGQGGVQQNGVENMPGVGFELGARLLIFDGYIDFMNLGQKESVTRGVLGLRAGIGSRDLRLVLRAGVGGIRDENGALAGNWAISGTRTGGVARAGIGMDVQLDPLFYLGFMVDAEAFIFPGWNNIGAGSTKGPCSCQEGTDVFATFKLTFELGI